jgi:hypothetical protein
MSACSRRIRLEATVGRLALVAFVILSAAPRRAPAGTVAEQRARLPPPAQCEDPVEGSWRSHDYRERRRFWTMYTLEIRRIDGTDRLRGTIANHTWVGAAEQSEPGACTGYDEELEFVISMDAEGRVDGNEIDFGGVGMWRLDQNRCGDYERSYGLEPRAYNLDHFTGTLDPELLEFQSIHNDGDGAVNEPTVFRRVACVEGAKVEEPAVVLVVPPAFYPPQEEQGGCGAR